MDNLFDPITAEFIIRRINNLRPDSKRIWGKMTVSQMIAHCQMPLKVALGDMKLKRTLIGFFFGRIARKQLMHPSEYKRGMPTDPSFIIKHEPSFEIERENLINLIHRFVKEGPATVGREPHPFFGKMKQKEWGILNWKHLDHHLRQFDC